MLHHTRDPLQLLAGAAALRGEVRPVLAAAFPPTVFNAERQHIDEPRMRSIYAAAE